MKSPQANSSAATPHSQLIGSGQGQQPSKGSGLFVAAVLSGLALLLVFAFLPELFPTCATSCWGTPETNRNGDLLFYADRVQHYQASHAAALPRSLEELTMDSEDPERLLSPWGHPYVYLPDRPAVGQFELLCLGSGGLLGGEELAADASYRNVPRRRRRGR